MKNFSLKFLLSPFKIILFIILIFFGYVVMNLFLYNYKKVKYADGFSKIELGMSKESVVELVGDPSEIGKCKSSIAIQGDSNCTEVFWYMVTLERWGVYFDKQDRVIDKMHNVSY